MKPANNYRKKRDKILDAMMHYATRADKFNGLSKTQAAKALDTLLLETIETVIGEGDHILSKQRQKAKELINAGEAE